MSLNFYSSTSYISHSLNILTVYLLKSNKHLICKDHQCQLQGGGDNGTLDGAEPHYSLEFLTVFLFLQSLSWGKQGVELLMFCSLSLLITLGEGFFLLHLVPSPVSQHLSTIPLQPPWTHRACKDWLGQGTASSLGCLAL